MPLKPSRRLPRKFNRRASASSRRIVQRRSQRKARQAKDYWRKIGRRIQRATKGLGQFFRKWLLITLVSVVALVIGLFLFSPIMKVQEVSILRGDTRLDIENVQQTLSPIFGKHLFLLSEQEVRLLLNDAIPDIDTVSIQKQYPATLIVEIHLDPLAAILRIDDPEATQESPEMAQAGSGAEVYDYLTSEGKYVVSFSEKHTESLPVIRLVDWGVRPSPGDLLVDPDMLYMMQDAEGALHQQFGLTVTSRTLFLRAQEFHLRTEPYTLWFDRRGSLQEQLKRYRIFLQNVDPSEITEYIDLRMSDRVVYK